MKPVKAWIGLSDGRPHFYQHVARVEIRPVPAKPKGPKERTQ